MTTTNAILMCSLANSDAALSLHCGSAHVVKPVVARRLWHVTEAALMKRMESG